MENPLKKPLLIAGMLLALPLATLATPALADDDECYVPMAQWQSRDAVRNWAEKQGWNVRRVKIDDGCYEIKGYDQSGREIEVKVDPATFAIVEFEYEDDDDDYRYKRNSARPAAPMPATPPDNGLFAPGTKPEVIVK